MMTREWCMSHGSCSMMLAHVLSKLSGLPLPKQCLQGAPEHTQHTRHLRASPQPEACLKRESEA